MKPYSFGSFRSGCVNGVLLNPFVLFVVGLSAAFLGVMLLGDVAGLRAGADEVETLVLHNVVELSDTPPGSDVLLQGRVAETNKPHYRDFVVYIREEYRQRNWRELERIVPALYVELPDGMVIIEDISWFEITTDPFKEAPPELTRGAVQVRGLRVGDPLLVRGRLVGNTPQPVIDDAWAYTGTQASYVAWQRVVAERSLTWGAVLIAVGVFALAVGGWQLMRFLREVRTEQSTQAAAYTIRKQTRRGRRP